MRALAPLLVLALAFAGCVTPPDATEAADAALGAVFLDPIVDDHDHASFADHNLSTSSMHLIGHTTMGADEPADSSSRGLFGNDEDGKPFSYIGEMDTWGNMTVVQILGRGSMPGFVVLDVSDPSMPTPIGRAEMPYSYVVDVKWSPDGTSVFAASQAGPQRTRAHSPVTDDPATAALTGNGFTQFDMSDPTNPIAVAGGLAEPTGCHMLSVKEIAGELYVFCVANVVKVYAYAEGGAWTEVSALRPVLAPTSVQRVVGEAVAAGPGAPNSLLLSAEPHDVTIQEDPLEEGRMIASVSYWDMGIMWYDVTDPRNPATLGSWEGMGADVYEGNVHGGALLERDGKRLAVVGPELLGSTFPALWVLDVTDFGAASVVAEWVPPGEHPTQGLLLTVHQFQVVGDRIYLAYNHAGVWVLDLPAILAGASKDDPTRPEVLGYYLPHQEVELYDPEVAAVPNTWDVNVKDGFIFASDRYTGFYVLHYAEDATGDEALSSST